MTRISNFRKQNPNEFLQKTFPIYVFATSVDKFRFTSADLSIFKVETVETSQMDGATKKYSIYFQIYAFKKHLFKIEISK